MSDLIVPHEQPEPVHQSSQRLADDLKAAGASELADRARRDEFNDFFSTSVHPQGDLRIVLLERIYTLERTARKAPRTDRIAMGAEAKALRRVHELALRGRYQATKAEAELWAANEDRILAARKIP